MSSGNITGSAVAVRGCQTAGLPRMLKTNKPHPQHTFTTCSAHETCARSTSRIDVFRIDVFTCRASEHAPPCAAAVPLHTGEGPAASAAAYTSAGTVRAPPGPLPAAVPQLMIRRWLKQLHAAALPSGCVRLPRGPAGHQQAAHLCAQPLPIRPGNPMLLLHASSGPHLALQGNLRSMHYRSLLRPLQPLQAVLAPARGIVSAAVVTQTCGG